MQPEPTTSRLSYGPKAMPEKPAGKGAARHIALVLCIALAAIGSATDSQAFGHGGRGGGHFGGHRGMMGHSHYGVHIASHGDYRGWHERSTYPGRAPRFEPVRWPGRHRNPGHGTDLPTRSWHRPPPSWTPVVPVNNPAPPPSSAPIIPTTASGTGTGGGTVPNPPSASAITTQAPTVARANSGVPASGETRFVPDEVLFTIRSDAPPQALEELLQRHRLVQLSTYRINLIGTTVYRYRIPDGRSVAAVVQALETEQQIVWTQPNYKFKLEGESRTAGLSGAQYALEKMHLYEAHRLAQGDATRVAVIDSGIDASHPELAGAIAESFDAIGTPGRPEKHGTAIAGIIAARSELTGVAPHAKLLAIRAFTEAPAKSGAEGTSAQILAGIDFAIAHKARIINMSFAGPRDPLLAQALAVAHQKGEILVAAAGNEGPNSAPLYPAADPNVIAVTATDPLDRLFAGANRGAYIRLAAPGTDILVAAPSGTYQFSSGTSMAAAHVSGIIALLLSLKPDLDPDAVRAVLMKTAHALAASAGEGSGTARMSDAYAALGAIAPTQARGAAELVRDRAVAVAMPSAR